jgi:hypothetical protein
MTGQSVFRRLRREDRGVALILVLLAMLVISALAAAIVFSARSETFASLNYRLDTQADYLAKAGIQQAANWLRSNRYAVVSPSVAPTYYSVTSDSSAYNLLTSNYQPVKCIAGCPALNSGVQLIGYGGGSSNYPNSAVATAFANDLVNVHVTGNSSNAGTFSVNATLLSYQTVTTGIPPAIAGPQPVETWLVTSLGQWTGGTGAVTATAEEQAIIQSVYAPSSGNALYGYCSVTMNGSAGVCTDSFNSALGQYGGGNASVASGHCDSSSANVIDSGAGVGANGGVTLGSNVTVSGNVTVGPGATSAAGGAACGTGYSGNTQSVKGEVVQGPYKAPPTVPTFPGNLNSAPAYSSTVTLPAGISLPTGVGGSPPNWPQGQFPYAPSLPANTTTCVGGTTCNGTAANPFLISSISISGNGTAVNLIGGPDVAHPVYYDIGSISESGKAQINVSGYVVLNVQGSISIKGNGVTNGLSNVVDVAPEMVQIQSAGSTVALGGNGAISALITAPNATVTLGGGGSSGYMVGSIQANTISDQGGYPVHYDIQLNRFGGLISVPVITAYSRKKF